MVHNLPEDLSDLMREKGRDGVAHLCILLRSAAMEEIVVREGLETSYLSHGEAPTLAGVWMNEVMSILGNVTSNCGAWLIS